MASTVDDVAVTWRTRRGLDSLLLLLLLPRQQDGGGGGATAWWCRRRRAMPRQQQGGGGGACAWPACVVLRMARHLHRRRRSSTGVVVAACYAPRHPEGGGGEAEAVRQVVAGRGLREPRQQARAPPPPHPPRCPARRAPTEDEVRFCAAGRPVGPSHCISGEGCMRGRQASRVQVRVSWGVSCGSQVRWPVGASGVERPPPRLFFMCYSSPHSTL